MYETYTCSRCGWVGPLLPEVNSCRACRTPLPKVFCTSCGKIYLRTSNRHRLCIECLRRYHRVHLKTYCKSAGYKRYRTSPSFREILHKQYRRRLSAANKAYEYMVKLNKAAKPRLLTENEWLEVCQFFGGCALCSEKNIAAKEYFVKFKDGGKYAAWNIIPVCEKCSASYAKQHYFKRLAVRLNSEFCRNSGINTDQRLKEIVTYVLERMPGDVREQLVAEGGSIQSFCLKPIETLEMRGAPSSGRDS